MMEEIIRWAFIVVAGGLNVAALINFCRTIALLKSEYKTTFDTISVCLAFVVELFAIYMFVYIWKM